ncbi:ATP-binding protein [Streptomyces sp. NPDC021212]|uniref:sensor histidine kinase n=1 Tax=Streptomyces sp. NPDC021212 TaxID=3365118 RepID=UPI0037AF0CA4
MVRTASSPGGPSTGLAAAWSAPAALMAVATAVIATIAPTGGKAPAVWCGVVATAIVALVSAEAARRGRDVAAQRAEGAAREAALLQDLRRQEAATIRLAEQHLPAAVARLQEGEFAEDVLLSVSAQDEALSPQSQAAHQALLRSVVEAVQAEESMRDSAQRGVVNIARRVQAIVHQQATDLRGMEDRHGQEPAFFADLLRLDHGTALIGRLADSIAVLGGARPGRQWSKAVPLYSVLRGAMSRILDYQRVELHTVAEVAVVGTAVEPLIHALAELLDNAIRYSPPKTRVHLTAVEVHMGIAIEVEDGGVGLSEEARSRAERMLKEARAGIDLNDLGESPRLGLAVVGRLAQAYDFKVALPPSAYGGVRAVLTVPKELLTTAPATGRAHGIGASSAPRSADRPAAAQGAPSRAATEAVTPRSATPDAYRNAGATAEAQETMDTARPAPVRADDRTEEEMPAEVERTASGLPQRRRRRPATGAGKRTTPLPGPAETAHEEPAPGVWMAELQSGLSADKPRAAPSRANSDTSDKGE